MAGIPDLAAVLTTARTAIQRAVEAVRAQAARPDLTDEAKAALTRLADKLEAVAADTDYTRVLGTIMDELRELVMNGKSIVTHHPTDTFI